MTTKDRVGVISFLWTFIITASIIILPITAHSAPPGIDAFKDASGVITWTTNPSSPFTGIVFSVKIVDHEEVIASNGTSHTVTVTYPNGGPTTNLPFLRKVNDYSAFYELFDGSITQPISHATYNGTYTFKVTRVSNSEWSEATDDLLIPGAPGSIPVTPPNEMTFTPGFPEPQSITAYFDDVYTNGSLYDDFASGFNPAKWTGQPGGVSFLGGEALFQKTWDTSTGNLWMRMVNPGAVNSIKATATVAVFSGSSPFTRVRIGGNFCRIAQGYVFAHVGLRGNEAVYAAAAEKMEGNHYISMSLVPLTSLGTVTQGNRYELSVAWDTVSQLTFRIVGLDDALDYSASYTVSGTISPASDPWKAIGLSAYSLVDTTTPTFSWTEVPEASHYRVRIYGTNDNTIYTGYATSPPLVMPPGILKPFGLYKYRIEALYDHQWFEWDNVAASDRNKTYFYVNTPNEAQAPHIDLWSNGVMAWNNSYTGEMTSFYVRVHDAQGVPGNIKSVKAAFPDGSTEVSLYLNYNETPTCGQYSGAYYGTIQSGTYTFTVEDKDGNIHTITENLTPNVISYPSETGMVPSHSTVLGGTGVAFDWDEVVGAAYYEVQLYDKDMSTLCYLRTTESQYTLPEGWLRENELYKYVVKAFREFPEDNFDNGSQAPIIPNDFFTTSSTGGTASPSLDLVNYGVVVFTAPHALTGVPTYELNIGAMVEDADGVPANIEKVEVTYPDGTTKKLLKYNVQPAYGYNYLYQELFTDLSSIHAGTYTITVYDFDGNQASLTDTLGNVATNAMPWATGVTPPNDVFLKDTTPTISWGGLSGASYYKVRILDSYGSDTTVHWSPELTQPEYTVPAGILSTNSTYAYRVYAYREAIGDDTDFVSSHVSFHSLNYHFTTGSLEGEVDGKDELILNFGPPYGLYRYDQAGGWKNASSGNPSQMVSVDLNGDGKDELVAAFPGYGLYSYDSKNGWQLIDSVSPENMIRLNNGIACDLGASGLRHWTQAGGWTQPPFPIGDPGAMAAVDIDSDGQDELVVALPGYGSGGLYIWKYESTTNPLQIINSVIPDNMIRLNNGVACYFASYGLLYYTQAGGWGPPWLASVDITKLLAVDIDNDGADELVVSVVSFGVYWRDKAGVWSPLNLVVPQNMIHLNNRIAFDYGADYGLYIWSQSGGWKSAKSEDPDKLLAVDIDNDGADEVVASFVGEGLLWLDKTGLWKNIDTIVPENMIRLNNDIACDFGASGLRSWSQPREVWDQWNTVNPSQMVMVDLNGDGTDELVAAFPGYGLYTYDSEYGWQRINTEIPEVMVNFRNGIACDFGPEYGLYLWDRTGDWQRINTVDPVIMISADVDEDGRDELIAGFTGHGLYYYDDPGLWTTTPINTALPDAMVRYSNGVVCDYGATLGLMSYSQAGGWVEFNPEDPDKIAVVDIDGDGKDELVVSFVGYGLYTYKPEGGTWDPINREIPESMIQLGNGIALDFGATYGLWVWSQAGGWQQRNTVDPGLMVAVDIDNDGVEELVVAFTGYGLYYFDDTDGWQLLNAVVPEDMKPINFYP